VLEHEVGVPTAHEAFHDDGRLNRGGTRRRLKAVLTDLVAEASRQAVRASDAA
jgi:hypothetical protein